MPRDRLLARSQRSAVRVSVTVLALALGLTLAGSQATASTSTLAVSPSTVGNGANLTSSYSTNTVSSTNWIGIYGPGQVPGQVGSITYEYAPDPAGTVTISTTSLSGVGQYQAYYLYNNGYQQLAGPIDFTVVGEPPGAAPGIVHMFAPFGQAALDDPFAVTVDARGDVWVADTGNNRAEELAPNGLPIDVLGSGSLDQPQGIALDPEGDVWVSDTGNNRLVEFSSSGKVLSTIGGPGSGDGHFDNPDGLDRVGPRGHVRSRPGQ